MQKVTPFLWFDGTAEEAAKFYTSIFKNSKITNTTRYSEEAAKVSGIPAGTLMTAVFQLDGLEFIALNGGPLFKLTEAISFVISCQSQAEVDHFWEKLSAGGKKSRCGWLTDKFGVTWQIHPTVLGQMLQDKDTAKSKRVMQAMLQMDKIDIQRLKQAYDQP